MYNYGTIETHTEFWAPVYKSSLVSYHQLSIFKSVYFAPDDNWVTKKSYKRKKNHYMYVMSYEAIAKKVRIIYGVPL